ncbi:MAG TPA: hypothetical protein DCM28_17395 [Phycisphaerales bacterium]|nr:hypothetical protein [Phycisphaerales bacterium]|tara:strand:- start:21876 stop:23012 length:1137 start_codon:yes stop_codon:yes gene_type:complete
MGQSPSTLAQVSARAGCSAATVSRVLNNSGTVSPAVRQNVLKAVKESGYKPRRTQRTVRDLVSATHPRTKTTESRFEVILHRHSPMEQISTNDGTMHLGPSSEVTGRDLISQTYSLASDFYMQILNGVMDELAFASNRAMVQASVDLMDPQIIKSVNRSEISGVILIGEYSPSLPDFLEQCHKPVVLVDIIHTGRADVVTTDNLAGIELAMDHLLELGHQKIGYVGAPRNRSFQERWATWQWKMASAGLAVNSQWVYHGPESIHDTVEDVKKILAGEPQRPTAMVCATDCGAMGVVRAAEQCGISIPDQLSVVGFDDTSASALVTPPLTTVHVPLREMGQRAVRQLLVNVSYESNLSGSIIRMSPELVVRQSTARCPS